MEPKRTWERRNDLARRLGVSTSTLWRWVKEGKLPAPHRVGRTLLFDRDAVDGAVARLPDENGGRP